MCVCSSEEAKTKIPHKVSATLAQALEKLDLSKKAEKEKLGQCVNGVLIVTAVILNAALTCTQ